MTRYPTPILIVAIWLAPWGGQQVALGSFEPTTVLVESLTSLEADAWVGKTVDDLTAVWGKPTRVKELKDGGKLLIYRFTLVDGAMMAPGESILLAPGSHHESPASVESWGTGSTLHTGSSGGLYMVTPDSAAAAVVGEMKATFRTDRYGNIVNAKIPTAKLKRRESSN